MQALCEEKSTKRSAKDVLDELKRYAEFDRGSVRDEKGWLEGAIELSAVQDVVVFEEDYAPPIVAFCGLPGFVTCAKLGPKYLESYLRHLLKGLFYWDTELDADKFVEVLLELGKARCTPLT